jgi:hypothetical protein
MKNVSFFRRVAAAACALALAPLPVLAQLSPTVLINCQESVGADFTDRGFYITTYPGDTLDSVTVYLHGGATTYTYQVGLIVTEKVYGGNLLASRSVSVSLGSTTKAVTIPFSNTPVNQGSRVCFKFNITKPSGAPDLFYQVPAFDYTGCPLVKQTEDTTPPLSTHRRDGVKLIVTGRRALEIGAGGVIQPAIDAAQAGDTVHVGAGNYYEELTLRSNVSVKGEAAGLVKLWPTEDPGVLIADCTGTEFSGFSVFPARGSVAEIGIRVAGGSPVVKNNIVSGFGHAGIAIYSSGGTASTAIVCGNRVVNNGDDLNGVLDHGILCLFSKPLISNNLIRGNEIGCYIGWHESDGAQFINNTVVDNQSDGLWCYQSNPVVKNNIVTGNTPGISASFANATPVLTYNNVWNNQGFGNYSAQQTGVIIIGTGSISVDPVFSPVAPDDYLLAPTSPCRDAGDPAAVYNDLDGSRNDMGWSGGPCASPEEVAAPFGGFLFTSVGNIPANYIGSDGLATVPAGDAAALRIPAWDHAAFGSQPWLFGVFGSGVAPSPYYYTIECKPHGAPVGEFAPLDHQLSKVKYTITPEGIVAAVQSVGPMWVSGVPYYQNTTNGGNVYWAHESLRFILNSPQLPDGVYDLRLKAFGTVYSPITLSGPANGLTLRINNKRPTVVIHAIARQNGSLIGECGIVGLTGPQENLSFRITASHADGFLDNYSLVALVGRNRFAGTIASDSHATNHAGQASWPGVTNTVFQSLPAMTAVPPTLSPWESCAYQFRLGAWARITNGYGLLYYNEFFWNLALNLNGADLDGDGDVDGDDLNMFAEAFGTSGN